MTADRALLLAIALSTISLTRGDAETPRELKSAAVVTPTVDPATTGRYLWRPVAIGGGGFVTGYSVDAAGDTRVARTDVYGAYLWRDDVDRWVQLVTSASMPVEDRQASKVDEGVFEVVVAPSDPKRIYMAIAGALYRSEDRGVSFKKTALPQVVFDANSEFRHYGPFIAVDARDPNLVFFGTPENGLWRSANGGEAWRQVEDVPPARDLRPLKPGIQAPGALVWFTPQNEVWAASPGAGVYRSTDRGISFKPLTSPSSEQPTTLKHGAFAPSGAFFAADQEGREIWKFDPLHGRQWTRLSKRPGLMPAAFASLAINPRNGHIFAFDEGGRVFGSQNDGETWRRYIRRVRVGAGEPPWLRVADQGYVATAQVVFDPVKPDRMWSASGTGVYFADGGSPLGLIWTSQTRGIEELVASDVIAPPGQAPMFAGWDFGVHRKTDLTQFSTTYGPKERVLIAVQQVDWSASDPSFLVTNASDTRNCCSEDGDAVLAGYSSDAGRTWTKFASLPQPPGTQATDPWRMSFGTIAVSSNDVNNIVWAPAYNRSPYFTKDRGRTWSRVVLPGEHLPNTGSFPARHMPRRTLAADRTLPGVFYLYHSGEAPNANLTGLWMTRNGGSNWSRIHTGELARDSGYAAKLRSVPRMGGHLFFTANGRNDNLKRSTDGGLTWRSLAGVDGVHDVAFGKAATGADYPAIYIAGYVRGEYGVWRSVDETKTWTQIGQFPVGTLDEVVSMDADKDVFGRVYLGFKGSGWRFGQPADCAPGPYAMGADRECFTTR